MTVTDTTTMRDYAQAIANLPEAAYLGSLVYFTISRADVELDKAKRDLGDVGLDTTLLKKELQPRHAFAKACRRFARKFKAADDVRSELLVRPAGDDDAQAYAQLILERVRMVKGEKRKIFFEKVGELTFTKGHRENGEVVGDGVDSRRTTGHLDRKDLTEEENDWLTERLALFAYDYDHLLNYMDSHAVRTFVREYIYRLRGTCVKESGGLYFVKQDQMEEVRKLAVWVDAIGSEFRTVELLNVADKREMIAQALEEETIGEVNRMMVEVAGILQNPDRKIEESTYEGYMHKAVDLSSKIQEYDNMLGQRATRAELEIGIFQQQVLALAARIKSSSTMQARTVPTTNAVGVSP